MRSITLRANEDFHSSQYENKYDLFKSQFKHVETEKKYFWRKSKDLIAHIRKKRWHGENRVSFMNLFSFEEWEKVGIVEQRTHSLNLCETCSKRHEKSKTISRQKKRNS